MVDRDTGDVKDRDAYLGEGMNFAGTVGAGGSVIPRGTVTSASRNANIFHPPRKPQRPFSDDCGPSNQARSDAAGNLTHTIDGDPITVPHVAGRTRMDGPDVSISPSQFDAIATAATGQRALEDPAWLKRGNAGGTLLDGLTGRTKEIGLRSRLSPSER